MANIFTCMDSWINGFNACKIKRYTLIGQYVNIRLINKPLINGIKPQGIPINIGTGPFIPGHPDNYRDRGTCPPTMCCRCYSGGTSLRGGGFNQIFSSADRVPPCSSVVADFGADASFPDRRNAVKGVAVAQAEREGGLNLIFWCVKTAFRGIFSVKYSFYEGLFNHFFYNKVILYFPIILK